MKRGTADMTAATVDTRTKAIGYVRVSTLKQGQNGFGLDAQRDAIERYCAANELNLVTVIPDVMTRQNRQDAWPCRSCGGDTGWPCRRARGACPRPCQPRHHRWRGQLVRQAHDEGWRLLSLDGVDSADEDQEFLNNIRIAFARRAAQDQRAHKGWFSGHEGGQATWPAVTDQTQQPLARRIVCMRMRIACPPR